MMEPNQLLTVDQFLDSRYELPEGGQWAELEAGRVSLLQPPDLDHGNTVLNLSKAIAAWALQAGGAYACFDLGLVVQSDPDTVRFPAVSFFVGGERFAESDKLATSTVPRLVVELASSADRYRILPGRIEGWLQWGVPCVWVIHPRQRQVEVVPERGDRERLMDSAVLTGGPYLEGFQVAVADLFVEPEWWKSPKRDSQPVDQG